VLQGVANSRHEEEQKQALRVDSQGEPGGMYAQLYLYRRSARFLLIALACVALLGSVAAPWSWGL
jgi:hypothetical protein